MLLNVWPWVWGAFELLAPIVVALCAIAPALGLGRSGIRRAHRAVTVRGGARYYTLLLRRRQRVRFSASVLLALRAEDGRWLLHRKDTGGDGASYWGPVGGVIKYHNSAYATHLDMQVEPHVSDALLDDMRFDLRVVLPVRSLARFLDWFDEGLSRESADVALVREIEEELGEAGVKSSLWKGGRFPPLSLCRTGRAMIFRDASVADLWHYRVFQVYRVEEPEMSKLIELLRKRSPAQLGWATNAEIDAGVLGGEVIGNHTEYLLRDLPQRGAVAMSAVEKLQPARGGSV